VSIEPALRAIASNKRLLILGWLKDPLEHFRSQAEGDLVEDGVCGRLIARKLHVSQPTACEHLRSLVRAGFIRGKRLRQWTFYKRDEAAIERVKRSITEAL
jgi:DNA-binding transcriptional ArsR family regulator